MMVAIDTALKLYYCQQMEMMMISFRIDIVRENDECLVYDKIDNLFLFTHPSSKEPKKYKEVCDG
jgi:hypothetical protein